jgi:hypothetical protein
MRGILEMGWSSIVVGTTAPMWLELAVVPGPAEPSRELAFAIVDVAMGMRSITSRVDVFPSW